MYLPWARRGRLNFAYSNALIGFTPLPDKLVFAALTPNFLSLRDQCAHSDAPRAAFGGCALDAPAGAVVVAIPRSEGKCTE